MPAPTLFNQALEFGEAFERHTDRKFHLAVYQRFDDLITEKGRIHTNLNDGMRHDRSHRINTRQNEGLSSIRVMHIARPVEKIDDLTGLRQGAE